MHGICLVASICADLLRELTLLPHADLIAGFNGWAPEKGKVGEGEE